VRWSPRAASLNSLTPEKQEKSKQTFDFSDVSIFFYTDSPFLMMSMLFVDIFSDL
jgi:hypothetical protein